MKPVVRLIALLAGVYVGFRFPDFDQRTDILVHRSIITHGLLAPLLLYIVLGSRQSPAPARLFVTGAALAVAVHLSFDLFPRGWWRHALIHLPMYGWTPVIFSWGWIALSIVLCFHIAFKSAQGWVETTLALVAIVAVFIYSLPHEDNLWRPMVAGLGAIAIAVAMGLRGGTREALQP